MKALRLRARFLFLLVPRVLAGAASATRLAGYSVTAGDVGATRIAQWCAHRAARTAAAHPPEYSAALDIFLRARQFGGAARFAHAVFDESGVEPAAAARLTGELVLGGDWSAALSVFDRLLRCCGGDLRRAVPAPLHPSGPGIRQALDALSRDAAADGVGIAPLRLETARLCLAFSAFETSAALFDAVAAGLALSPRDTIAHGYAIVRSAPAGDTCTARQIAPEHFESLADEPDWQILAASVAFARGDRAAATSAVERAIRGGHRGLADLESVVADGLAIVDTLLSMPQALAIESTAGLPRESRETDAFAESAVDDALPKIFVCGNGWSGSGAVYDALIEHDRVAVAPDVPGDPFVNECTNSEMMFVQGSAGLGRLWREARDAGRVERRDLWQLFRGHLLGLGAIGHTEHKGANAARHLLELYGSRYTAVFRTLLEDIARLDAGAPLSRSRAVLVRATESLSRLFAGADDARCVVFNNAMFGPNLDMAEIFADFRLVVVARDPVDQYADRRQQDLKHWMTARRFVPFYAASRAAFHEQRGRMAPQLRDKVREVAFERFVREAGYRREVLAWLLPPAMTVGEQRLFSPEASSRNIGFGQAFLEAPDVRVLRAALGQWQATTRGDPDNFPSNT